MENGFSPAEFCVRFAALTARSQSQTGNLGQGSGKLSGCAKARCRLWQEPGTQPVPAACSRLG